MYDISRQASQKKNSNSTQILNHQPSKDSYTEGLHVTKVLT